MPEFALGPLSQIPPGEGRNFHVADRRIAIFHTRGGGVYATQAFCPHKHGPLADGLLDDATIICPLHDRMFSLATGTGIGNDYTIATYPIHLGSDGTLTLTIG
jgi:nitrite reductase (NADH) small subunit